MTVKRKIVVFLLIFLWLVLLLPGAAGAAAATPAMLTLEQARDLALTQGTAYLLLQLGQEQAAEMLNMTRRQFGLGAVGIADARTQKQQIDELQSLIDDKLEQISLLEEDIAAWKAGQAELQKDGEEYTALQQQINRAYAELAEHRQVVDNVRPAFVYMIPRYYQTKSLEDMARPQLDPAVASADAVADALLTQPRVIAYNVENLYLSLLALQKQESYLEQTLAMLQKMERREAILMELGMSTSLRLAAAGAKVQGGEEALKSLRAGGQNLSRSFLSLLGLPLDFDFALQPVEPAAAAMDWDKAVAPDLTRSVRYLRAQSNLQKKVEDLEDTPRGDNSSYRLAELAVKEAEINLEHTLKALKSNYESRREQLLPAQKSLQNAGAARDNAHLILKQAELKYKLGTIARVELEQQELALLEAELRYRTAQNDHYLAHRAYLLAREGIELPAQQ